MTIAYSGDSITFPDNSVQATAPKVGMVNRIINGAMVIDQRNAGASVPIDGIFAYTLDRWFSDDVSEGAWTIQRSTTAPAGFTNSLLVTVTTADTSLGATQRCRFSQIIEGYNIGDLAWGTASAQAVTMSFWVRSSVTGTFSGSFLNSAENRCYPFSYTISTANTFEYKTITIPGDTTGTWVTDNGAGIRINFSLGVGSSLKGTAGAWVSAVLLGATGETPLIGTSGATFYITGVQLEKGSTATSFDYRPYGTELGLCQRYFYKTNIDNQTICTGGLAGSCYSISAGTMSINHPVNMRAAPTGVFGGASNTLYIAGVNGAQTYTIAGTNLGSQSSWYEFNATGVQNGFGLVYNGQYSSSAEL